MGQDAHIGVAVPLGGTPLPLPELMGLIRQAGFDSVDLGLCDVSEPGGALTLPDWMEWVKLLGQAVRDNGLITGQAHAMMGTMASADFDYTPPPEIYIRTLRACEELGCQDLVIHPVIFAQAMADHAMRERLMDYNARWFQDLACPAWDMGVNINIENLYDRRESPVPTPLTRRPEDLPELLERIGEPGFGICLDTGHAHIMEWDIPGEIRRFGSRLRTLHLHDNFGSIWPVVPDQHLFPGFGTVDFPGVFRALRDIGYAGIINLEPGDYLLSMPQRAAFAALTAAAEIARAYWIEAG